MSAEQTGSSLVDLLRSYRDRLQQRFEYSIEQPPSAEPGEHRADDCALYDCYIDF